MTGIDLPRRRTVPGRDIAALDLEEGRRVRTRALREDQAAVVLIGRRAEGVAVHEDVAAEDGAALPLQRALEEHVGGCARRDVPDVGLEVEPLPVARHVHAERADLRAGTDEVELRPESDGRAAGGEGERHDVRVTVDLALLQPEVLDALAPVLERGETELRPVLDDDLGDLVDQRPDPRHARVLEVEGRLRMVSEHREHAREVRAGRRDVDVDGDRDAELDLGGHVDEHPTGPRRVVERDGAVLVTAGPDLGRRREPTEMALDECGMLDRSLTEVHHDDPGRLGLRVLDDRAQDTIDDGDLDAAARDAGERTVRDGRPVDGSDERALDVEAHVERRGPPELIGTAVRPGLTGEAVGRRAAPRDEPRGLAGGLARGREGGRVQCGEGRHPIAPSISMAMSRFSSTEYSIGSSREIGSMKPRTIIAVASSSSMPRCCM